MSADGDAPDEAAEDDFKTVRGNTDVAGRRPQGSEAPRAEGDDVNREPITPRKINPTISRDLNTICLKCLQKESARRYVSAGELRDDLRRLSQGFPIQARPVSASEHIWRWCRRNRMVASLLLAVVITVGAGAAIGPYANRQSNQVQQNLDTRLDFARQTLEAAIESAELNEVFTEDRLDKLDLRDWRSVEITRFPGFVSKR